MNRVDPAHSVDAALPLLQRGRAIAAQRFRSALNCDGKDAGASGETAGEGNEDGGDGGDGDTSASTRGPSDRAQHWRTDVALRVLRQAVQDDPGTPFTAGLSSALESLADDVTLGQRHRPANWRLLFPIDSPYIPSTEVEILCTNGEIRIYLRSSDEDAYRRLGQAVPALDAALQRRGVRAQATAVFLVSSLGAA